jgi:hypothetical protein
MIAAISMIAPVCSIVAVAVAIAGLFVLSSPARVRVLFSSQTNYGRLFSSVIALAAIMSLAWQAAVWHNPNNGIPGTPPTVLFGVFLSFAICVRAAVLWCTRRK